MSEPTLKPLPFPLPALSGAAALALAACGLLGCGGGGGSSSAPTTISTGTTPVTPPADPNYYNVPSTTLGAVVNNASVTFTYWNPGASTVSVQLYTKWDDSLTSPAANIAMAKDANGVWASAPVALTGPNFYVYNVNGTFVLDPYARSMAQWRHVGTTTTIPGDPIGKGAILDPAPILPDGGAWTLYSGSSAYFNGAALKGTNGTTSAPYAYQSARDAIIYEAGVRDLTVDPLLTGFKTGHKWGTFKGMIDILPHIQKLGVTHIQLLCPLENYTYDQTLNGTRELSTTQTSGANYNWGYDPQNYFTPTGMYSATPTDPALRIQELRTLINEIHKQGMGVILDVVYNHTANNNVLGDAGLLGYYYRSSANNGAGSRDVKSENIMTRKLIVDSVLQWVKDYRVDGFRFDLMGVLDYQTINAAYAAAYAANPNTLFLGEGWTGYYTGATTDYNGNTTAGADQAHAAQFLGKNIGMFSDSYRQIFKNGYPNDGATAFLTTKGQAPAGLFANIAGLPTNFTPLSSNGVVNYLTCHDNLCLYDVLSLATGSTKAGDAVILQRAKVGYAVLLTSQGIAFLHAGDEMFRTKEASVLGAANTKTGGGRSFVDNSYNASDAINMVNWSTVYAGDPIAGGFTNYATGQNGYQLYQYTQGLIALRKATNAFRLPDAAVAANLTQLLPTGVGATTLAFGYKAISTNGTGTYYVFHNADSVAQTFTLPAAITGAQLLVDGASAGLTALPPSTTVTLSADGKTVTVAPLTSAIYRN
jgi:pullulanase/glycogen debranching enzyme